MYNFEGFINLAKNKSVNNLCFTIGIGRRCDTGLVGGVVKSSG